MQKEPVRQDTTRVAYGAPAAESALATNKVLRNTYMLLSMTLLFSAAMAGAAMAFNMPYFGPIITLVGYFGLLALLTAKFTLLSEPSGFPVALSLLILVGPLLLPLRGILHGRPRSHVYASFLALF